MDSIIQLADKDEKKKHKQLYTNDLKFDEQKQSEQYPLNVQYFTSDLIFEELIKNIEGIQENQEIKKVMGEYMEECRKLYLLNNNGELERLSKVVKGEIEEVKNEIAKKGGSIEQKNNIIDKLTENLNTLNIEIEEYENFLNENPCNISKENSFGIQAKQKIGDLSEWKNRIFKDVENLYKDIYFYREEQKNLIQVRDSLILNKKDRLNQLNNIRNKTFDLENDIENIQIKLNGRRDQMQRLEKKLTDQPSQQMELCEDKREFENKVLIFQRKVKKQVYFFEQEVKESNFKLYLATFIIIFLLVAFIYPTDKS